eukprot:scaffold664856_cov59-Prasinocladus_malaysianus.AAC.1
MLENFCSASGPFMAAQPWSSAIADRFIGDVENKVVGLIGVCLVSAGLVTKCSRRVDGKVTWL